MSLHRLVLRSFIKTRKDKANGWGDDNVCSKLLHSFLAAMPEEFPKNISYLF